MAAKALSDRTLGKVERHNSQVDGIHQETNPKDRVEENMELDADIEGDNAQSRKGTIQQIYYKNDI